MNAIIPSGACEESALALAPGGAEVVALAAWRAARRPSVGDRVGAVSHGGVGGPVQINAEHAMREASPVIEEDEVAAVLTDGAAAFTGPVPGCGQVLRVVAGIPIVMAGRFAPGDELRALWRLLPESSEGGCIAQLRDEHGHLVEERRVSAALAAGVFGQS